MATLAVALVAFGAVVWMAPLVAFGAVVWVAFGPVPLCVASCSLFFGWLFRLIS